MIAIVPHSNSPVKRKNEMVNYCKTLSNSLQSRESSHQMTTDVNQDRPTGNVWLHCLLRGGKLCADWQYGG